MQNSASAANYSASRNSPYWHKPFVRSLQDEVQSAFRSPILMIWGAALLVLLIGCANASHLVLASVVARRQEFLLRRALGMSIGELVAGILLDQLLIGLIAGAVGLFLSRGLIACLGVLLPISWPQTANIGLDFAALLFTLGLSLLVGALVAIHPCWDMACESDLSPSGLSAGHRVDTMHTNRRWLWLVNVSQTALVTVLMFGSGLLYEP